METSPLFPRADLKKLFTSRARHELRSTSVTTLTLEARAASATSSGLRACCWS
jgi:hypothetical protein